LLLSFSFNGTSFPCKDTVKGLVLGLNSPGSLVNRKWKIADEAQTRVVDFLNARAHEFHQVGCMDMIMSLSLPVRVQPNGRRLGMSCRLRHPGFNSH
jgi:hypothetical protein